MSDCDPHGTCITCSDQGVPARVVSVDDASGLARCADGQDVAIDLVAPVAPGDDVLVHAGVAIARLEDTH